MTMTKTVDGDLLVRKLTALSNINAMENLYQCGIEQERVIGALTKERDALAEQVKALESDKARVDWLDQNIFNRENIDWVTGKPHKTLNMWVMFAPKGVQGSARNIIDVAIKGVAQ